MNFLYQCNQATLGRFLGCERALNMPYFKILGFISGILINPLGFGLMEAQTVHVYYTNNALETGSIAADPVAEFPQPTNAPSGSDNAGTITPNPSIKFQTMVGVAAAFSEIGALALLCLPSDQQEDVIKHLFEVQTGAEFQMCRLPVGTSNFATSAYSYDEKANDYE